MILTRADKRQMMTPSGRLDGRDWAGWGEPRPVGPKQFLVPVGRKPAAPEGIGRAASAVTNLESLPIAMLKLDSPAVHPQQGQPQIPWQYLFINLWRLAQPTGVTPGTANGITVNAHGQVVNTQASGASIESPSLTGTPTSVTPPANDNSNAIATTAWVHNEGFLTGNQNITVSGDVSGSGATAITATVVGLQHRPLSSAAPAVGQALIWNGSSWVPGQAGIPDAPADGQRYVRQNNAWSVIVSP